MRHSGGNDCNLYARPDDTVREKIRFRVLIVVALRAPITIDVYEIYFHAQARTYFTRVVRCAVIVSHYIVLVYYW